MQNERIKNENKWQTIKQEHIMEKTKKKIIVYLFLFSPCVCT